MKHLRLFPNAQVRDSVLADIDYPVLHSTDGVGIGVKPGVPGPDYSEPFYVENITQQTETLRITGYDNGESDPASYLEIPVEFSTDGTNWSSLGTTGAEPLTRTLQPGDKVYLRATTNVWCEYQRDPYIDHGCTILGVSKVGGNIMSLLYGSNFNGRETTFPNGSTFNFKMLFNYNETLVSASELILPATTLTQQCYQQMFYGCTSLTTAPELPATTLARSCYYSMFHNCTSLTTAPVLPATTLTYGCYQQMFRDCEALVTAPALPATTLAEYCYQSMFSDCTSLTTAPALPATTLANSCYLGMFEMCTSLTTAPALPATTLAQTCYGNMFSGCSSLTTAPALPATTLAQQCYGQMFSYCTSLTTVPALPATTLANSCYDSMFFECTNLNYIKCLATDISATRCLYNWTYGVSATGTFVKNPNMSSWTTGNNGIPSGWTVQDAA